MAHTSRKCQLSLSENSSPPSKRNNPPTDVISAGPSNTANLPDSTITPGSDSKPICFRITCIPEGWSKVDLWKALVCLDPSLNDLKSRLDLFPSCYGHGQVALLKLDVCTNYFEVRKPNMPYREELEDVELVIDHQFYGMTPLNNPGEVIEAEYCTAHYTPCPGADYSSVIAVTGLGGHAYGSWKSRQSSRMWLKDLLPNAVLGLRVMTYGYDSRILGKRKSEVRMSDYTAKFIQHLENATSTNRPIIFIGHSLGGILILQALIELNRSPENSDRKRILASANTIFFAGTPHGGLRTDELEQMAKFELGDDHSMLNLLKQLREDSENLELQRKDLKTMWSSISKVVTFYETAKAPVIQRSMSGDYLLSGNEFKMVRRFSAQLHIPGELQYPVEENHSDMMKLKEGDSTYETVIREMKKILEGIRFPERNKRQGLESQIIVPAPLFIVPFSKDPDFVGREDIFERLQQVLQRKSDFQRKAALWGLGGIGKTMIAVEFCYRWHKAEPGAHIFWVHGNSHETFKASYLEIGKMAGLKEDGEEALLKRVRMWLDSSASKDWMMIIDNLDDLDCNPQKHIPVKRGTILYTTRDRRLIGHPTYVSATHGIEVTAMTNEEAIRTFWKLIAAKRDTIEVYEEISRELLLLLGYLPLAIAQAAACIRQTGMDPSKYLETFKEYEHIQEYCMNITLPVEQNGGQHSRALMTTWKIAVDKIQQQNSNSIQLLEIISFFSPEEIPEELIQAVPVFKNRWSPIFTDALIPLINFALLYRLESSNYRLHPLLRFWVQVQIDSKYNMREKQKRVESAVKSVYDTCPHNVLNNMQQCTRLLSHAVTTLEHACHYKLESNSRWNLEDYVGEVHFRKGNYGGAINFFQRVLAGKENTLRNNHPSTLATVNNIASVFCDQGEYGKALEWYRRALDGKEKTLGNDHLDTLNTVNNIGNVFCNQGEYGKALEWYRRALDGREKAHGNDHPDTLRTVNNIALVFCNQGEYGKAREWYQRAVDGMEKTLGNGHPDTLTAVNNIASVFCDQGE
ncbi:hypothetical protein BDD12DRAFT_912762 [Trichophaea hybrida]|nr:hypothetical protein BDD12DRAFT_912762 [Trichophaea hybrida]